MKFLLTCVVMLCAAVSMADTIVIRQPGLVEGICGAAVGVVRGAGNLVTNLVTGSTVVIQTPSGTAPTAVATQTAVVQQPVVVQQPTVYVQQPAVYVQQPVYYTPYYYRPAYHYGWGSPHWHWRYPWYHW